MIEARNAHAITKCDELIMVLGGFSGRERLNTVECYVVEEKKWIKVAAMKQRRHYLTACSMNNDNVFVFGGFYGGSDNEVNDTIERYKMSENQWSLLTIRLKNPLWACMAVPISDDEIMVIGGKNKNRNQDVNVLNLTSKQWKSLPQMNQMRVSHKAFVVE